MAKFFQIFLIAEITRGSIYIGIEPTGGFVHLDLIQLEMILNTTVGDNINTMKTTF